MHAFGILCVVLAGFRLLGGMYAIWKHVKMRDDLVFAMVDDAIWTAVMGIAGMLLIRASGRLRAVVKTTGEDVAHMVRAFDAIATAFLVPLIAVPVAFVVAVILGE